VRSGNFHCRENVSKKNLQVAARRIFERVRVQITLPEAEREAKLWDWLLGTKELDLTINNIDLNMGNPLLTRTKYSSEDVLPVHDLTENEDEEEIEIDTLIVDGETVSQGVSSNDNSWILYINTTPFLKVRRERQDNRMQYLLSVPDLHMRFTVMPNAEQCFDNPLYSPELRQYFARQWWGYIFLWGNVNQRVAERTRRTTATIEVQHKILKTFDITKRNLVIDEYLLQRSSIISANQLALAEKLLFKSSMMELKRRKLEKPDDDEKWSKNLVKLDESKLRFLEAFRNVYNDCNTTQTRCAREIRDISDGKSKIQQSVVSRMLCKTYLPKEPVTLQAIKSWMTMKGQGKIF